MDAAQLDQFARAFALLGLLSGALGAVFVLALFWVSARLIRFIASSDWWLDRTYERRLNASQRGRMSPSLLFWLSAVLVALLSACSSPGAHFSDSHGVFVERAKAAGW